MKKKYLSLLLAGTMAVTCASPALAMAAEDAAPSDGALWSEEVTADGWVRVTNEGGATLGYDPESGVTIIEQDGYAFKDLDKDGELDVYEDWRESYEDRAADLVSKMTIEDMSGLRINSAIGTVETDMSVALDMNGNELMPRIVDEGIRYFIMYPVAFGTPIENVTPMSNALQQLAESTTLGIPMMLNCDPTTTMTGTVTSMALAATFSPESVAMLSTRVAKLYRAAGITMSLSPQVDLETDPRSQSTNTFTEDPALAADLVDAMISAYQSTYDEEGNDLGWGTDSLAVQFKHFFGNLSNEGGRNYHDFTGKYTVMSEEDVDTQLVPFVEGGFTLSGATGQAAGIMVTYTVPCDEDGEPYDDSTSGVGGAWNEFVLEKLSEYDFHGMVSTDSLIMDEMDLGYMVMLQTAYNVDDLTTPEKVYEMFYLGVDQSMGDPTFDEVMEAYDLYVDYEGQEAADTNWIEAAYDCVLPIFEVGNFENPYVDTEEAAVVIEENTPDSMNDLAQSTIVMLKNEGVIAENADAAVQKAYIVSNAEELPISKKTIKNYFETVDDISEAEVAIVFVDSPTKANTGYDDENEEWVPISLQYRPYTADADAVLEESLTGDVTEGTSSSPYGAVGSEEKENRAYYDVTTEVTNEADLDLILETAEAAHAAGIPVIVCVNASGAFCVDEFESEVDAILVGFGVDESNYLPLAAGIVEPSALLPLQFPANMEAVEEQASGTPRDMECYVDADGNTYDFGYGLNWSGVISDERTEKYCVDVQVGLNLEDAEADAE